MLKIENLSKQFKGNDFYSLSDVSLEIGKGEIVGLIGKNGAGKSTLMKMMAKSQRPTSGTITYRGIDINSKDNVLEDFGIMIDPVFYPEMSVMDNLKFYLKLHGKQELYPNIEKTLRLVELWEARNRKPKGFSFGMKQRTALAIALVAEPDFLILDEPFVGLDPIGVQKLIDILKQWSSERQISMLISSHQLGELEALCNRYVYIEGGKLVDSFEGKEQPSVVVHLHPSANTALLDSYLSSDVILEGRLLDISTASSRSTLNEIFKVLAENDMIESIYFSKYFSLLLILSIYFALFFASSLLVHYTRVVHMEFGTTQIVSDTLYYTLLEMVSIFTVFLKGVLAISVAAFASLRFGTGTTMTIAIVLTVTMMILSAIGGPIAALLPTGYQQFTQTVENIWIGLVGPVTVTAVYGLVLNTLSIKKFKSLEF